jgi:hypothetical protein
MQQNQQMMMAGSGSGKGKNKGNQKGMGQSQKDLNQKMQQTLQKGSQSKGGMSEDLAKLAREQAQIRKMLQDMMDNQKVLKLVRS